MFVAGCEKEPKPNEQSQLEVNPDYVPIDWEETSVTAYDDSTGSYQIQFTDSVPDIHPGSVIAIDRDTVVLYRFVTSANVSGNTVNVTTVEASLTDIFANTELTLTTLPEGKTKANGIVLHPVEAYLLDAAGGYQAIDINLQRKDDTRFTENLWTGMLYNLDGTTLFSGNNWSVTLERMNASIGIDIEMLLNFGARTEHEFVDNLIDRYRSKALKIEAALVGKFNTEQMIRFDAHGSFSFTPDYDLWKHDLFPPASIKFMAGPVPIVLTLRSDLYRQVEASGSGEISAYTGFSDHAEGRVGFVWQQAGGISPVNDFENTFSFTPPTLEGRGQVQAKVWVFPRIKVMLYDRVGPSFDFMPWMSDTVRGGFREQTMGQTNDYCAWTLDHYAGLDLRCGLSRNHIFFGYEVDNVSTDRLTVANRKLYHSPKRVEHLSGRPASGQTQQVSFRVYDQNYLFNQEQPTPFPQVVKFEADGQLSSEYGLAAGGTVSVSWTPNDNDILYAKLYDINGNVLAQDTVHAGESSGDWVDLGLPSGLLWATRNVGATSPEDYGDYFAWGETQPKEVYDWSTYIYCNDGNYSPTYYGTLTKYCDYPGCGYYDFTDNLTILQPSDDAATANYGGRMPTQADWQELIDNTTIQLQTQNGVNGIIFTGSNDNSLFLPLAGYHYFDGFLQDGIVGYYWSSSLYTDQMNPYHAWCFSFGLGSRERFIGHSVRAVRQN
jgi:hypothetical protein